MPPVPPVLLPAPQYLPGTGETGPLEARRYTLTHSDRTGVLQLSIGGLCSLSAGCAGLQV